MNSKVSVVIRNKNQASALEFLLKNLTGRYADDLDEVIVIDNLSTDNSGEIVKKYNCKLVSISNFSYGGSANLAAESARNDIVVVFSAHAYPVSNDFFKQIMLKFQGNTNLAGLRCLHGSNDYRNYINNISAKTDPNRSGLIFCGSVFNRKVWEKHRFKDDITTFEDKEWTLRVLAAGYDIAFSPSIFSYEIKRSRRQDFFRFKNEIIGGYQLWHTDHSLITVLKALIGSLLHSFKNGILDVYFIFLRFIFMMGFIFNKPKKF